MGDRVRPVRARPWPERPVRAANKSGSGHRRGATDFHLPARPLAVSTRRLILAALLCGLAILVAFTVQVLLGRF